MRRIVLAAALLLAACAKKEEAPKAADGEPIPVKGERKAPSTRPPLENCKWENFIAADLGVAMSVQECSPPAKEWVFTVVGNTVRQVPKELAGDPAKGEPVVEVFEKKEDETLEQAIERQFLPKIPARERGRCRVLSPAPQIELNDSGKQSAAIVPDEKYAIEVAKRRTQSPGVVACGVYGQADGIEYFEYHPNETKAKFVFVRAGQDQPLFDQNTLRLK